MGPSDLLFRVPLGVDRKPLFRSQAALARAMVRKSDHFGEKKYGTCNSMLSHYLKASSDPTFRIMPESYRDVILDLIEERLSGDPYDPADLVKKQFLESLLPLETTEEGRSFLAGEDRLLQEFVAELAKAKFSVFCRWDEGLSSSNGNVRRIYHELFRFLEIHQKDDEFEDSPFHFFYSNEYHRIKFLKSLVEENKEISENEKEIGRPICSLMRRRFNTTILTNPAFALRVVVMDPISIFQRGYFLYLNQRGALLPLKLADQEIEDWCLNVYNPYLETTSSSIKRN